MTHAALAKQEAAMPVIHEVATITSKGHITTLPDDLARSMLAASKNDWNQ